MNKKIIIQNDRGGKSYCVVSGDRDFDEQLCELYFGSAKPEGSFGAAFCTDRIEIRDYMAWEVRASFPVLAVEDTQMDVLLKWTDITDESYK